MAIIANEMPECQARRILMPTLTSRETHSCATRPHFWHLIGAAWGAVHTCPVREPGRGFGSGAGRGSVDAGHVGWARLSLPVEVRRGRRRRSRLGHSADPL